MPDPWYPPEFDELGPKASACGEAGGCTGQRVGPLRIVYGRGQLDVLAAARIRPTSGAYAHGMLMHQFAERTKAARAAAERAVESVRSTWAQWNAPMQAPWITRKKLGKSGKLYTLADVQRNVVSRNLQVQNAIKKSGNREGRQPWGCNPSKCSGCSRRNLPWRSSDRRPHGPHAR